MPPLPGPAAEPRPGSASRGPGRSTRAGAVLRRLIYSRPGAGARAPRCARPMRPLPRPRPHGMPGSRLLAALCGALLCASGLFAASGESIAPPSGPRPSSPRRSEVLRGALPPPPLFTNLAEEPGPCGGATSPAAPRLHAAMRSASPAGSAPWCSGQRKRLESGAGTRDTG